MTNTGAHLFAVELLDRLGESPNRPTFLHSLGGCSFDEPALVEHVCWADKLVCFTLWLDTGMAEFRVPSATRVRFSTC